MGYIVSQLAFFFFFIVWVPSTSSLGPADCIISDQAGRVGYMTTGTIASNRMAFTSDSTTLIVSSVNHYSLAYRHEMKLFDISDDGINGGAVKYEDFTPLDPGAINATAVAVSRDDQEIYVYYPESTTLRSFNISDIYNGAESLILGGTFQGPGHYLGTAPNGFVVLVVSAKIYRFKKDTTTGSLVAKDSVNIPDTGKNVSCATGDSTGNNVLVLVHDTIYVYSVGGGIVDNYHTLSPTSTSGPYDDSDFIAITKDSTSIYLQNSAKDGLVLISATYNDTNTLLSLTSPSADETSPRIDFATAHPDSSTLYCGRTSNGKLRQYDRDPSDGSLSSDCDDVHDENDNAVFNSVFVSPDGMNVYFGGGEKIPVFRTHTSIPHALSPTTKAPTPSPVVSTPSPTPAPTPTPTLAPLPTQEDFGMLLVRSYRHTVRTYIGCFGDLRKSRVLPVSRGEDDAMTTQMCQDLCEGYPFFGTEYERECYCGDSSVDYDALEESTACTMTCAGDESEICGGTDAISLYRVDDAYAVAPTPTPTRASLPTQAPTPAPTGSRTPADPSQAIYIPALISAELSETDSSFVLGFNRMCYCTSGVEMVDSPFPAPALCGQDFQTREFDHGCDINRLLDAATLNFFGTSTTTCKWSNDSSQAMVTFSEASGITWDPAPSITLKGRYIYGLADSSSVVQPTIFSEGTVELSLRRPAPELTEAKFSDDGASIKILFSPDGSASSGLLNASDAGSGSGPGSCNALLDASTVALAGDGVLCQWTGQRELTVWIGFGPRLVADSGSISCNGNRETSCVTLLDGGVRTEAFAVLSSSGSTPILAPDQPLGVSAVLVAPQEVGLCGEFTLDGRASSGSVSRTLLTVWSVAAAAGDFAVAAVEHALVPSQGGLLATLNATILEIGFEFSFTLTVSNFLGAVDETTVTVTRRNDDVPTVAVVGPAAKAVERSRLTSLRMAASPPACEEASSLAYTWEESGVAGYDEVGTAFVGLLGSDPTTLLIPPYSLGYPGSSYHFKASSSLRSSASSSSAYVEVTVVQGDLRAFISGGRNRQHTRGADLVLDGSGSSDDDEIPESEFPLRYKWVCSQNCSGVADGWTSSEEPVFVIPGGNLQAGLVYEFSLNVTKGTANSNVAYGLLRSDVAAVNIEVVSFEAPEVVVAASGGGVKLDPTRKIVVFGSVVGQSAGEVEQSSNLLWTQTQGDLDTGAEDWSVLFASPQTGTNLVIRPNVLTGGSTYTFRLSAVDAVSLATGFAELSILANAAPSGGYIDATPRTGVAALDTFSLECLSWSDDVEDLPLVFSFSTQDETGAQHAVSVSKTQSPEWQGPLPLGRVADNYTINIVGHVSDSYGATATSLTDVHGQSVAVRVTGWEASWSELGLLDTLEGSFTAAAEKIQYIPGETTSTVRAFASLLIDEIDGTSIVSPEEINGYQALVEVMIIAAAADFDQLDYSPTFAGAALGTLSLLSSSRDALGTESQGLLLESLSSILGLAVEDGYWDLSISVPALQVLDGVIGASSSDSVISSGEMGDDAAKSVSLIVESTVLLMEVGMVDDEDATTIQSDYMQASCLVTSSTKRMSFTAGSSAVTFDAGATITSPDSTRRRTTALERPQQPNNCKRGGCASQRRQGFHRRLEEHSTSLSTIIVTHLGFSVNGRPSTIVEAGVTQIKALSTSSREDIPIAAPVTMFMRASVVSLEEMPSCSYFNEETGSWDSRGLVLESVQELSVGEAGEVEILISCVSFHLSDFTVTTTEVESVFQPIALTAGVELFRSREVSALGIVLTATVILMMAAVWGVSRMADRRAKMAEELEVKVLDWYIATGEPKRKPTLPDLWSSSNKLVVQRKLKRRRNQALSWGDRVWFDLTDMFVAWYHRGRVVGLHIVENHPWAGILKPSTSNLTLTRGQLSIMIFAQVMVQMMVEACFQGNSTDPKVKIVQILVGLAATVPASIIIPAAFKASATPPASVTVNHDWKQVILTVADQGQLKHTRNKDRKERWLREPNYFFAVYHLVAAKLGHEPTADSQLANSTKAGAALARGTSLVINGVAQVFLNMACGIVCVFIGVDSNIDTALAAAVFCSLIQSLLSIDALLSNKGTKFITLGFGTLSNLVFASMALTTLQLVLAFYGNNQGRGITLLYGMVAGVSIVKLVVSNVGELMPCMDAINELSMAQLVYAKRYRRNNSTAKRGVCDQTRRRALVQNRSATVIQSCVRQILARKRFVRKNEVQAWNGEDVKGTRKKLNNRAYIFLVTYTLVVVWINLCYVAVYDTPTIWRWTAATSVTVLIDVFLRKPFSVLMMSALRTIRDVVQAPQKSNIWRTKY